ncbi:hypothetical protein HOLleu_16658 [Holothuria leucospilota]|uniref:Uncharacterized protein n=1 Tax=Holothuria leucospilota TaxID=206669 RepID=A0A9Q1C6G5_HOLLE|nr:hypothetical protein HOLleu_16658 [Holothuria leucospilota]
MKEKRTLKTERKNSYDPVNIWRDRHTRDQSFTWISNIFHYILCRLGVFLICNSFMHMVSNTSISTSHKSDHCIVNLDINISIENRGPGFWKFNNFLFKDSHYLKLITDLVHNTKCMYVNNDASFIWEYMKYSIRKSTTAYSKAKAREIRNTEKDLLMEIAHLEQTLYPSSDFVLNRIRDARNRPQTIYDIKIQGILVRSRTRGFKEGKRNTKYFFEFREKE